MRVGNHKCPTCPHPAKCKKAGKCLKHSKKKTVKKAVKKPVRRKKRK